MDMTDQPAPLDQKATPPEKDVSIYEGFPGRMTGGFDRDALLALSFYKTCDEKLVDRLAAYLSAGIEALRPIGLDKLVIGLSGGADSILSAAIALRALGPDRVIGVTIDMGREEEAERVERIIAGVECIGVPHRIIDGRPVREAFMEIGGSSSPWRDINIDTRVIQSLIFQTADDNGGAVIATSDYSERLLGRYTEHFYGHLAPLAGLYKTEVNELMELLDLKRALSDDRPGCEDYWFDDEVLGADYDVIDPLLHLFTERGMSVDDVAETYGFDDRDWLGRVAGRIRLQVNRVIEQPLRREEI